MKRLLLFILALNAFFGSFSQVPQTERDALIAFFNATNGTTNWDVNTNWATTNPVSTWHGITTAFIDGVEHVTQIDLNSNRLWGTIPTEITNLTYLEYLDLQINLLYSEIPNNLGDLQNLTWVDLRQNSLTGSIPTSITTIPNLFVFVVSWNALSGDIPDFSAQISNQLTYLWFDNNNFQFGDFENEYQFYSTKLGGNFIYAPQKQVGEKHDEAVAIGNGTLLNALIVSGAQNNYSWWRINADGSDGGFIGNTSSTYVAINSVDDYKWLYYYEVTSNLVPGLTLRSQYYKIDDLPSNSPDFDALLALYNSTNGDNWTDNTNWLDDTKPLSSWYGIYGVENNRVTNLELYNNLTGTIPVSIGDLTELTHLVVINNDISGEIPDGIWDLTKMKMLIIGGQQSGQLTLPNGIPTKISGMQDLEWLNLTGVPLTQPLQPELFNLPNLKRLRIVECGLTGSLPKEFGEIEDILASGNEFEGAIPPEVINSSINDRLSISGNYFDFRDLEPLLATNARSYLNYSPQRTKDVPQSLEFPPGEDVTMSITDTRYNKTKESKGEGDVYQWFKDNVVITGANSSTFTIANAQESDSGIYYCEITNPLVSELIIRGSDITLIVDSALSTNEENEFESIALYPNPSKGVVNLKGDEIINALCRLYDTNGRLIWEQKLPTKYNVFDLSTLDDGLYFLKIITTRGNISKKLVVDN